MVSAAAAAAAAEEDVISENGQLHTHTHTVADIADKLLPVIGDDDELMLLLLLLLLLLQLQL